MSDCHMLRMNVCDAGRHAGTQRHEKGLIFTNSVPLKTDCILRRHNRDIVGFLWNRGSIRVRATVCDPDRQVETKRHEQGLTFIWVEDMYF